jgi:CDGSH-type Zn-finger protein/uncharacterized Fe-S cluster protein YjdI
VPPKSLIRKYSSPEIEVNYDIRRCIHAEECIRNLNAVFDRSKVPWIQPGEADADRVAQVIQLCPSGALQTPRSFKPSANTVIPALNGPLYVSGDLEIVDGEGNVVHHDTRIALCRCGASRNKPFCDNRHLEIEFQAQGHSMSESEGKDSNVHGGKLQILPSENGPYRLIGAFVLLGAQERREYQSDSIALCRCGASREKPFCDNTHRLMDFSADSW